MDWDGNNSRNPAARRSNHHLDECDVSYWGSPAEVGAKLRAARELPKSLESKFFRSRCAFECPSDSEALNEVNS
jgi:hypothetical protein